MASELPKDVMQLLEKIAKEKGIKDFAIAAAPGSNQHDGFLGIISRVSIVGKNEINEPIELSVIVKLPPTNKVRREQFGTNTVFEREIMAYTKYLPILEEFQKSKGLTAENGFFSFPKCYGTIFEPEEANYALVLEDLKVDNYEMLDKYAIIDLDHITMALKEMAKMHGISFALRDQRPDDYNQFANLKDLMAMLSDLNEQYQKMVLDMAINCLNETTDEKLLRKMKSIKNDYNKHLRDCSASGTSKFAVIGHGDCWNNNFMFTYNSEKIPQKMCILDWQIMRPSSPILDLVYFLFTSTLKPFRDEHYNSLLQIYYTTLADTINAAGSDAMKLFSYNDFQEQLKQYGKYVLLMAPMVLQFITADDKEMPDIDVFAEQMSNKASNNEDIAKFINLAPKSLFNERMRDVIIDVIDYGYF